MNITDPAADLPVLKQPRGLSWLLRLWFGLSLPVSRRAYATSGFSLMLLKYLGEAGAIHYYTSLLMTPLDFINPVLTMRQEFFKAPGPTWLGIALVAWSIPFLWIMVAMSVRRAIDAGHRGSTGLVVLVPLIGMLFMLYFCFQKRSTASRTLTTDEPGSAETGIAPPAPLQLDHGLRSALLGIAASVGIGLGVLALVIYGTGNYGNVLFMGMPILVSTISAFLYNRPHPRSLRGSLVIANLSILLIGIAILLFALEGIICIVMFLPLGFSIGTLGGMIGYMLATIAPVQKRTMLLLLALFPLLTGAELLYRPTPLYEVISSVEIDAPPEEVWPHVISFPPLPEPAAWYFRLGIACPQEATIEGSGVGAIRHCIFSTGSFVEPITAWEPNRRLAFDVTEQPSPMTELSPYRHIHPPHLDSTLRSKRGEFRLIALPGGRTRLEGSTWYELEMYPQDYWTLWSDACIKRIHIRVLDHIKNVTEASLDGNNRR